MARRLTPGKVPGPGSLEGGWSSGAADDADLEPTNELLARHELAGPRHLLVGHERILRRGYSFTDGTDPDTGELAT